MQFIVSLVMSESDLRVDTGLRHFTINPNYQKKVLKSLGFSLGEMDFLVNHPKLVEIFNPGPKWWTD